MNGFTQTQHSRKHREFRRKERGYISLLAVFTIAILMFAMLLFAFKRAINSQSVQANVQAQTDYREKEETILRSIVAITPNRAILAMQDRSFNDPNPETNPLSFQNIFASALVQANARQSISDGVRAQLAIPVSFDGNTGDSNLTRPDLIFTPVLANAGFVTGGLNHNFGPGFPPVLDSADPIAADDLFPIISNLKQYGARADNLPGVALPTAIYQDFNIIPYPNISFGYSTPGQPFVAKRNWWAFNMNLAQSDNDLTGLSRLNRDFVLSIYEIPSQLPISAASYMAFGEHADGTAWQDVNIEGNVFVGRARTEGNFNLASLSTRRGAELTETSMVGGIGNQDYVDSPFEGDFRERYRNNSGELFPISLSSESGKAAFVPINRGAGFFDRFAHTNQIDTISPTTWDNYSVGALQCAMNLDITDCVSDIDPTPTKMVFSYIANGARVEQFIDRTQTEPGVGHQWVLVANENETVVFDSPVDLAYGIDGQFFFRNQMSGSVTFDNPTFGDPYKGRLKVGYVKMSPFEIKNLPSGQICVGFYPELLPRYLAALGADGVAVNHSISINVNYDPTRGGSARLTPPSMNPCTDQDYGVILQQCADFTPFPNGFSIVTNLRVYYGDNFNIVQKTTPPPDGLIPPAIGYFPPCSLFAPEKRYGISFEPPRVEMRGQVGSVANESAVNPVNPLDAIGVSGDSMDADQIAVNLSTITHPAELPPIFMMNWLIVLEERR